MSISSIQNEIINLSNQISKLNKGLADEQKNEAKKMTEIFRIQRSITKNTSLLMLNTKTRQIEILNNDIIKSKSKQADINKKWGDTQKKLTNKQVELTREQERVQRMVQRQRDIEQQQIVNLQQYKSVTNNEETEKELNGLFSKYSEGNCKILPIQHNISKEEVSKNSPILSDILGLKTADYNIEEIAKELYEVVK